MENLGGLNHLKQKCCSIQIFYTSINYCITIDTPKYDSLPQNVLVKKINLDGNKTKV